MVLVTGAGTIGAEITRLLQDRKVITIDLHEETIYNLTEEVISPVKNVNLLDEKALEDIFTNNNIDTVIHTAAYKHLNIVEKNPRAAVLNNIVATRNLIQKSIKHNVKQFIFISTDKAVNPISTMGMTKRFSELYIQNIKTDMVMSIVRFGNILDSSGSVIPKFRKQIANNQSLTVTDKDVSRYFMSLTKACELVIEVIGNSHNSIHILDMGEPVKIVDIAKKMIKESGKELEVVFTGLKPGEKVQEELGTTLKTEYSTKLLDKHMRKLLKLEDKEVKSFLENICIETN